MDVGTTLKILYLFCDQRDRKSTYKKEKCKGRMFLEIRTVYFLSVRRKI